MSVSIIGFIIAYFYGIFVFVLGRRQVVRQRVLVPSFAGSIPADPAKLIGKSVGLIFYSCRLTAIDKIAYLWYNGGIVALLELGRICLDP